MTIPGVHIGKHSIWIPNLEIKVPFQWGGRVQKYKHFNEASYDLETLAEEYALLKYLENIRMGVPVKGWIYYKNLISEHIGGWWSDPLGAYGFQIADAKKLSPGGFDFEKLKKDPLLQGSEGAWNDLLKEGNVINGYLIDVRRSWFDHIQYKCNIDSMPRYNEDKILLFERLCKEATFPFRQREKPYQEFYLDGRWISAEREVVRRAELLNIQLGLGSFSVLDMGCQIGGFLHFCIRQNMERLIGIDIQPEYIELARDLARANGFNICFRCMDVEANLTEVVDWIKKICPNGIDHLLLLSMGKHFKGRLQTLWKIVDKIDAKNVYLETNSIKEKGETPYDDDIKRRGGKHVGYSVDRNLRKLFKIERV